MPFVRTLPYQPNVCNQHQHRNPEEARPWETPRVEQGVEVKITGLLRELSSLSATKNNTVCHSYCELFLLLLLLLLLLLYTTILEIKARSFCKLSTPEVYLPFPLFYFLLLCFVVLETGSLCVDQASVRLRALPGSTAQC